MFNVRRQLNLTAGAVFAIAPAEVHCIRHVVVGRTKDAMTYNPLCVGVISLPKATDLIEKDHVENMEKVVVEVVVAIWAVRDENNNDEEAICADGKEAEDEVVATGGLR